jgi:hypothetical protein
MKTDFTVANGYIYASESSNCLRIRQNAESGEIWASAQRLTTFHKDGIILRESLQRMTARSA